MLVKCMVFSSLIFSFVHSQQQGTSIERDEPNERRNQNIF